MKIAILDGYQNVTFKLADWSAVAERADITVFDDHIVDTPLATSDRSASIPCGAQSRPSV
jgi:hypothetical protein